MAPGSGRRAWIAAGGAAALIAIAGAATFLLTSGSAAPGRADPTDPELVALGREVYADHCAACHGAGLEGQPDWKTPLPTGGFPAPPHDATGHTWHHPDRVLFGVVKEGGGAFAPPGFHSNMPAFGGALDDREIWAVLAYIKSTWPPTVLARQRQIDEAAR